MAGIFEGGLKKAPGPELLETEQQKSAIDWIMKLMQGGTPTIPTQGIEGMTDIEKTAQTLLGQTLSNTGMPAGYDLGMSELSKTLGGEYKPETSPYYQGFRQQLEQIKEEGLADIARESQKGGMLYSTPRTGTQAKYLGDIGAKSMSALGTLYEAERGRMAGAVPQALQYGQFAAQQPYNKLAAVSQYGGLPREIGQAGQTAKYQQQLSTTMFPYNQTSQIAQILAQYSPYYQPQYYQTPSAWQKYVSPFLSLGTTAAGLKTAKII